MTTWWSKIKRFLRPARRETTQARSSSDPYGIWLYFQCGRCHTPVRVRVDRQADLNPAEEEDPGAYVLHKDVMDSRCFQLMHAVVWFDQAFNIVAADVAGGTMISEDDYLALTQKAQGL